MQRQSLGSPLSKLHLHQAAGVVVVADDSSLDIHRSSSKDISAFSSSSSDDDSKATTKPHRMSTSAPSSSTSPKKVIHVIPVLTVLCFLILFLFSHTPSPSDLAQINGFTGLNNHIDSADDEIGVEVRRFIDVRKSDVVVIRSLREIGSETRRLAPTRSRSHRKIADF